MLLIVCGEDTTSSRAHVLTLQKTHREKGDYVQTFDASMIEDILKEEQGTVTLFAQKKVYFVENLTRVISRKTAAKTRELVKSVTHNPDLTIIDWESNKSAREITLKEAQIKEFKLPQSIFKLLDDCYPGQLQTFLKQFHTLCQTLEPEFIFAMLCRHTRQLLLASHDALSGSMPSWQRAKLYSQARRWDSDDLVTFYEGLTRIDQNIKSGKAAVGLQKAIDILVCFYLR